MLGQSNPILPTRLGRMARSAGYPTSGAFAGAMGISRPATGLLNAAAFLAGNPVNFPHLASVGPLYDKRVSRPRMPPDSEVGPRQTLGDRQDLVRQGRNGPNSGRPPDNDRNRGATRPTIGVGARRGADTMRGNWRAGCPKSRQRANYLPSWVSHLCSSLQEHRDGRMGRV